MARTDLEIGIRFAGAVMRPGDKVLLTTDVCTSEAAQEIGDQLAEKFPGVEFYLIDHVTGALVYSDEAASG